MTKNVLTIDVDTPVEEVLRIILDKKVIRLPVTSSGKLVGAIAITTYSRTMWDLSLWLTRIFIRISVKTRRGRMELTAADKSLTNGDHGLPCERA